MNLKVLGSSSHGNCYILSTPTGTLLIEAGLRWKEIQKGLGFDLSDVAGCLITHEHNDHSKAVKEVTRAGIDCYMSMGTLRTFDYFITHRLMPVISGIQIDISDFTILPFDAEHDAAQPFGYLIKYRPTGEKLLFLTDSYYCKYRFEGLNYIMIECNYIKDILDQSQLDDYRKQRLLKSHFSLEHVKDFLKANDLSQCQEIILLHLSDGNSDAARMIREIEELTGIKPKIAEPGLEVKFNHFPY